MPQHPGVRHSFSNRKGSAVFTSVNIAAAVCLGFARATLTLMTLMPYCVSSPKARILETCSNGVMLCLGLGWGDRHQKQQLHASHCMF